ncbi:TSC22 domain family protein 1-like [Musca vetustissima]|uniref:TSC22 domain family protein 1-like n=1 Tax=Musca vetustissima TaxID=27455 RepID=UPI002AB71B08|nr:TSC22 domain family protein 1-like [Musca vetustissima]
MKGLHSGLLEAANANKVSAAILKKILLLVAVLLMSSSSFVRTDVSELYLPPHHGNSHTASHISKPSQQFLPPATSYGVPDTSLNTAHRSGSAATENGSSGTQNSASYSDGQNTAGSSPAVITHVHNGGHNVIYVGNHQGHESAGSSNYNQYAAPTVSDSNHHEHYHEADHSHHQHEDQHHHHSGQVAAPSAVSLQTAPAPAIQFASQAAYPQASVIPSFSYIIPAFNYFIPAQIQAQVGAAAASTVPSQTTAQVEFGGAKYAANGGYKLLISAVAVLICITLCQAENNSTNDKATVEITINTASQAAQSTAPVQQPAANNVLPRFPVPITSNNPSAFSYSQGVTIPSLPYANAAPAFAVVVPGPTPVAQYPSQGSSVLVPSSQYYGTSSFGSIQGSGQGGYIQAFPKTIIICFVALLSLSFAHGISNQYLPPHEGSASSISALRAAPIKTNFVQAASAPVVNYAAPAAAAVSHGHSGGFPSGGFSQAASAPAPRFAAPAAVAPAPRHVAAAPHPVASAPHFAASAPAPHYAAPAPRQVAPAPHYAAASVPVPHYAAPAAVSHGASHRFSSAASPQINVAPAAVHGHSGGHSVGFVQAQSAPAVRYSAPAVAPAPRYSAPAAVHGGGHSAGFVQAQSAPAVRYSAPAVAPRYSAPAAVHGHSGGHSAGVAHAQSAPAPRYSAPAVHHGHGGGHSVGFVQAASAPAPRHAAPAPRYAAPAATQHFAASAPAPRYSAPAAVTQSFGNAHAASAPAVSYAAPAAYNNDYHGNEVGTQYAANGGYVVV